MPGAKKNFFGLEGFVWFIGVVEDRKDPEKLGRLKIRCFGWHTPDKELIPTDALPWAHPMLPINSPATYTAKEGDMVFGFFMDGDSAQNPVVFGVLPGIPKTKPNYDFGFTDPRTSFGSEPTKQAYPTRLNEPTNSRLARNRTDETIIDKRKKSLKKGVLIAGGGTWSEPTPTFAPVYPFNYVHETEAGHAFEMDDTPGNERVQLAHKSGSFIEMDSKGNRVEKVSNDNYTVIMGKDYVYVKGDCAISVDGDCKIIAKGKLRLEGSDIEIVTSGDLKMKGKDVKIESTDDMSLKAKKEMKIGSSKGASLSGKTVTLQGKDIDLAAAQINMQSGSASRPSSSGLTATRSGEAEETSNTSTSNTSTSQDGVSGKDSTTGKTTFESSTFGEAKDAISGALTDLKSSLPTEELTSNMFNFESKMNSLSGDILNLSDANLGEIRIGNFSVVNGASKEGIDLNIVSSLLPDQPTDVGFKIGKQLYPKTEYISTANTNGGD